MSEQLPEDVDNTIITDNFYLDTFLTKNTAYVQDLAVREDKLRKDNPKPDNIHKSTYDFQIDRAVDVSIMKDAAKPDFSQAEIIAKRIEDSVSKVDSLKQNMGSATTEELDLFIETVKSELEKTTADKNLLDSATKKAIALAEASYYRIGSILTEIMKLRTAIKIEETRKRNQALHPTEPELYQSRVAQVVNPEDGRIVPY